MLKQILPWQYCPRCRSEQLSQYDAKSYKCRQCGFIYYHNTAAAVTAIIEVEGRIIVTRRAFEPHKDSLDMPGGFVDYDETAHQALTREVKEELNLDLTDLRFLTTAPNWYHYKDVAYPVLDIFFICRVLDMDQLKLDKEISDYLLLAPNDIQLEQFAFESTKNGLLYYLNTL
ncbi:MAG: NUDIX domain-containing protein [Sedimentisphaerales bacterium]|nr:NUDIX domain-containing protein [Sedimentisphaerales bacterium]